MKITIQRQTGDHSSVLALYNVDRERHFQPKLLASIASYRADFLR